MDKFELSQTYKTCI